jgi:hypothetical protein
MLFRTRLAFLFLSLMFLFGACGGRDPNWKETHPVTGEVYVDGAPAAMLLVNCTDLAGIDTEQPTLSKAYTDDAGKFEISTYETGDGMPEGEYVLTFMWGKFDAISRGYSGPDKLKDKYLDPKKSEHKFTVEKGKPTDLGRIELTTK